MNHSIAALAKPFAPFIWLKPVLVVSIAPRVKTRGNSISLFPGCEKMPD
jgi:hypothetical protein